MNNNLFQNNFKRLNDYDLNILKRIPILMRFAALVIICNFVIYDADKASIFTWVTYEDYYNFKS